MNLNLSSIDIVLSNMIIDSLDIVQPNWLDRQPFDMEALMRHVGGLSSSAVIDTNDMQCLFDMMPTIANDHGMTFRHNGNYAWMDDKTDENDIPIIGNSQNC